MRKRNDTRIEKEQQGAPACKNKAFDHPPVLTTLPVIVALDFPETMIVGRIIICEGTGFDRGTRYCRATYGDPQKFRNWPDGLSEVGFYALAKAGPCFWREFGFNIQRRPDGSWRSLVGVAVPNNPFQPMLDRLDGPGASAAEAQIIEGLGA